MADRKIFDGKLSISTRFFISQNFSNEIICSINFFTIFQTAQHRSAPARKATFSFSGPRMRPAALRNFNHIPTHHRQISIISRSRAPLADRREFSPVRRKPIRERTAEVAIKRHRTESEESRKRRSRTLEASRTKNVRRNAAEPIDPSRTRVCMSKSKVA